ISCRLSESLPQCRSSCRHVHIVRMGMYRSMPFLVNNRTFTFSSAGEPGVHRGPKNIPVRGPLVVLPAQQ
ncbi:hypothetical protein O5282_05350, partial [Escherichia coli]|nr:hypothetical protein [Escherichia coli]